jgi:hypothetical protein
MENPKAFQLTTDVWMVPCQINSNHHNFIPIIHPFSSQSQQKDEKSRNPWNPEEDQELQLLVKTRGQNNWSSIAKELNSKVHKSFPFRKGKQCRERWINHLNPKLQKHQWTEEEDETIRVLQKSLRNKWSTISRALNGRTENQVKNRWKSIKKNIDLRNLERGSSLKICVVKDESQYLDNFEKNLEGLPYLLEDFELSGNLGNEVKRIDFGMIEMDNQEVPPLVMFSFTSDIDGSLGYWVQSSNHSKLDLNFLCLDKVDPGEKIQTEGSYFGMFSDTFNLSLCGGFEGESLSLNFNPEDEKEVSVKTVKKII